MVNVSDIGKRLLLGRKLRSTQLHETLLPKRIALPVFASDALSSVAYAPDEIFLTLSLAGLVAYSFSWKIAILVAIVMLVVVASYRQNVHAYPSGGGDYEVATVNLGPNAGLTVAAALIVDYVLTVAVSVSSGVQNAKAVFLSFDIDCIDPGFAPGTGTPESGGLTPREAFRLLGIVTREGLAGMEVVEVAPPYDHAEVTAFLASRVVLEALSGIAWRRRRAAASRSVRSALFQCRTMPLWLSVNDTNTPMMYSWINLLVEASNSQINTPARAARMTMPLLNTRRSPIVRN